MCLFVGRPVSTYVAASRVARPRILSRAFGYFTMPYETVAATVVSTGPRPRKWGTGYGACEPMLDQFCGLHITHVLNYSTDGTARTAKLKPKWQMRWCLRRNALHGAMAPMALPAVRFLAWATYGSMTMRQMKSPQSLMTRSQ